MDRALERPRPDRDDEPTLLWIVFFVGLFPVLASIARAEVWGTEPTLGLLMSILAAVGLVARARRPRRVESDAHRRPG